MFGVVFDLATEQAEALHPGRLQGAYREAGAVLRRFGFMRAQQSFYITDRDDLANLTAALDALRRLPWFGGVVRDIRAFQIDLWSDFTEFMQSGPVI